MFQQLMRNRRIVGEVKYGRASGRRGEVDCLHQIRARLDRWESTRNTEFLVDVANYIMLEYLCFYPERGNDDCGYTWTDDLFPLRSPEARKLTVAACHTVLSQMLDQYYWNGGTAALWYAMFYTHRLFDAAGGVSRMSAFDSGGRWTL